MKVQVEEDADQFLSSSVKQANVGICPLDSLSSHLQDETKHTVSGRVLGSKVDSVVLDLGNGFLHVRLVCNSTTYNREQRMRVSVTWRGCSSASPKSANGDGAGAKRILRKK